MKRALILALGIIGCIGIAAYFLNEYDTTSLESRAFDKHTSLGSVRMHPVESTLASAASEHAGPHQLKDNSSSKIQQPDSDTELVPLGESLQQFSEHGGYLAGLAYSAKEADWMDRHGYPTREQWSARLDDSLERLKRKADTGNATAAYLYASALYAQHQCEPRGGAAAVTCAQAMRHAAVLGSIPAMVEYPSRSHWANPDASESRRAMDNAWALLAQALGEPTAAGGVMPANNHSRTKGEAIAIAQAREALPSLWAKVNSERSRQGLSPLAPDPHPLSLAQKSRMYAELNDDPNAPIMIYPRR